MTQAVYAGLVIDGPCFGRNISAHMPRIQLAVTPEAHQRLMSGGPTNPHRDILFLQVPYVWSAGVWSCGEYLNAWDDWEGDKLEDGRVKPGKNRKVS